MLGNIPKAVSRRNFWAVLLVHALFMIQHNHGFWSRSMEDPGMRLRRQCSRIHMYRPKFYNGTALLSSLPLDYSIILERSSALSGIIAGTSSRIPDTTSKEYRREFNNDVRMSHLGAIKQVYAIIDLFMEGAGGLHRKIMSSSVEGVIRKVYTEEYIDREILLHLDTLVCRCFEYQSAPALVSIRTLWFLNLCHLQWMPSESSPDEEIEAATRLLLSWMRFSQSSHFPPPPTEYCLDIFVLVGDRNATMTSSLWELYLSHRECNPDRRFFEKILDMLSSSREEVWQSRQYTVLRDMHRLQGARMNSQLDPTVAELESALWAASRHGNVQQATWLYRQLQVSVSPSSDLNTVYTRAWFLSFCNCKAEGSSVYLERLLEHIRLGDPSNPINSREYYNMALRQLGSSKKSGSGVRAEKLYNRMLTLFAQTDEEKWLPDDESVRCVCRAYLNEEPFNPWNAQHALRMQRKISRRCLYTPKVA